MFGRVVRSLMSVTSTFQLGISSYFCIEPREVRQNARVQLLFRAYRRFREGLVYVPYHSWWNDDQTATSCLTDWPNHPVSLHDVRRSTRTKSEMTQLSQLLFNKQFNSYRVAIVVEGEPRTAKILCLSDQKLTMNDE